MLAFLSHPDLAQKTFLVPHDDLATLHYYFPKTKFMTYYEEAEIPDQIRSEPLDAVIYHDRTQSLAVCSARASDLKEALLVVACP